MLFEVDFFNECGCFGGVVCFGGSILEEAHSPHSFGGNILMCLSVLEEDFYGCMQFGGRHYVEELWRSLVFPPPKN